MSIDADTVNTRKARTLRLYRTLPKLLRDPMREIERMGTIRSGGEIVRIGLGVAHPYLVTHPDHVQHILRENSPNYVRDGVFWSPLRRLFGESILSTGEAWKVSRRALQPVFTARHVTSVTERMAETIWQAVGTFDESARSGKPIDALTEIGDVVNRTVLGIFFGDKISAAETDVLIPAFETIATSLGFRFLLPFVPDAIRLPGDRAFIEAVRTIDEIMYALADKYQHQPGEDQDVFSALCRARAAEGSGLTDQWVRDNLVAIFATATETTAAALTWLWPLLDADPAVAARVREEVDRVVADDRPRAAHVKDFVYIRQVIQEVLRLYPVGWMFPRLVVESDTIGGVRVKAGETVLISPFLTHRLDTVWNEPMVFDPDRFAADQESRRHRYAYFPFGGGPHQCVGMHVFNVECLLIVAAMFRRFDPVLRNPVPAMPKVGASLRPRERVELILRPAEPRSAENGDRSNEGNGHDSIRH